MRPSSPLSPRFDTTPTTPSRFENLQPPSSARTMQTRVAPPTTAAGNQTRRAQTHSLRLPSLPRFHPANYPSTQTSTSATASSASTSTTPDTNASPTSPQPPHSPRSSHNRMYSDAQKQLFAHQRENLAAQAVRDRCTAKPTSPRLAPLGSPGGVVTPLELEGEQGYLVAGVGREEGARVAEKELVEGLIREEARRMERRGSGGGR
ncbi:hypothetical protein MBLNU230_g6683t1 [Neophaeotheca triangularis]